MNKTNIDKYLTTLYLKSRNDFKAGYSELIIPKIIGIDNRSSKNILHYLSEKNLIDTKNGLGDNIVLTYQGIEYVEELRKGKKHSRLLSLREQDLFHQHQEWFSVFFINMR